MHRFVLLHILYSLKAKVVPKPPRPPMMTNISMDIFHSRANRRSMLLEEGYDAESMRDTASIGGDVAEAKAKEAGQEMAVEKEPQQQQQQQQQKEEEEKKEIKVDLLKEAEETL